MLTENNIRKFWTTFFVVLTAIGIVTSVFYGVMFDRSRADNEVYQTQSDNGYNEAVYSVIDSMKNIDSSLGKVAISTNPSQQVKLLSNVTVHANNVNQKLAMLPISSSDNYESAQKFVNQTQDYATYLVGKVVENGGLSKSERQSLIELDNTAERFTREMQKALKGDDNALSDVDGLSNVFDQIENDVFVYEKLIYDGPFSDSVEKKTVKSANTITVEQATEKVSNTFGEANYVGTIKNGGTFLSFETASGRVLLTQDGRLCEFDSSNVEGESVYNKEQCITKAEEFCHDHGFDVKGVWVSKTQEGVIYVNLAPVKDGVIIYPDLVKVAVSTVSGKVVGFESRAYLINHTERNVSFGSITEAVAQKALDDNLQVVGTNKTLILKGDKEYLCYEFECRGNDRQYFVYVDSTTGKEIEIFKVIENTEGYTVM